MVIIKQLHPNGLKCATQTITLYLVQISGQSDFTIHFGIRKKAKSKARSYRALEQKNKKSRVGEGFNADNSKDE